MSPRSSVHPPYVGFIISLRKIGQRRILSVQFRSSMNLTKSSSKECSVSQKLPTAVPEIADPEHVQKRVCWYIRKLQIISNLRAIVPQLPNLNPQPQPCSNDPLSQPRAVSPSNLQSSAASLQLSCAVRANCTLPFTIYPDPANSVLRRCTGQQW